MRKVFNEKHPGGIFFTAIKYFISGRYEFPDMTKEEEPNNGHRNVGQTLFTSSTDGTVTPAKSDIAH